MAKNKVQNRQGCHLHGCHWRLVRQCTRAGKLPTARVGPVGSMRRGAALLEVVVALSILLMAMSVVGAVFRNGQHNIELAERISRAQIMTERLLVELDTGYLDMEDRREESGWFGVEAMAGMSWRVEIEPHETIDRLIKVDVHIYLGDPEGPENERQRLLSTRVLRVEPKGLDLEKDFGLDEDQIEQLTEAIPGGVAMLDPTDFDPRALAQLDLETLAELLPTLIQAFGANIAGGQIGGLLEALESGDLGALEEAAREVGGDLGGSVPSEGDQSRGGDRTLRGGGGTRQGLRERGGGGRP